MPWFQVDDQLGFHPKTIAAGNAAMGLWVRAGSWCQQHGTDGFVPNDIARSMGTPAQAKRLVETRMWVVAEGGYRFHQWGDRQLSAEQIDERRRKRAEAGRKGGRMSGEIRRAASKTGSKSTSKTRSTNEANASALAEAEANQMPQQNRTPVPVLTSGYLEGGSLVTNARENEPPPATCADHAILEPDCAACDTASAEHETWLKGLLAALEPVRHCPRHPAGTEAPCRDCRTQRQVHDQWRRDREAAVTERDRAAAIAQSAAAQQSAQARAKARAACPLGCAERHGYRETGEVCDHDPHTDERRARHLAKIRADLTAKAAAKTARTPEPAPSPDRPADTHTAEESADAHTRT